MLGEELGAGIVIFGGDLQLGGIANDQSFGLDERDLPAGQIPGKVMMLASPDGKLVYGIKPKDGSGGEILYITTRAAEQRGDKLPPELVQ